MKKAFLFVIVVSLLCACLFVSNDHDHKSILRAMGEWDSRVTQADLRGKSPFEVAAFLDRQKLKHDPYSGLHDVQDPLPSTMSHKEGSIIAHTGRIASVFSSGGVEDWSVQICFSFDSRDKCVSSYVWSQGTKAEPQ